MEAIYAALKALHITAVIVLIAGLLIQSLTIRMRAAQLQSAGADASPIDALTPIAQWWDSRVTVSALLIVWLLGLQLAQISHRLAEPWVIGKFAILLALSALHGMQSGILKRGYVAGAAPPLAANSAPLVLILTAAAVFLAVFKPH